MKKRNSLFAAALLLLALAAPASAYTLGPGQEGFLGCPFNCTFLLNNVTNNITNSTEPVYCQQSTYNSTNGTCGLCSITKSLSGGQNFSSVEGACNLNVSCSGAEYQQMRYPTQIHISKDGEAFKIELSIWNYKNESYLNWSVPVGTKDLVDQTHEFDYICAHEVITETNMQTCSQYLDPLLNASSPLIWQLSTGQTFCSKELVNCTAQLRAAAMENQTWQQNYIQKSRDWEQSEARLAECVYNLNDAGGSCAARVNNVSGELFKYRQHTVDGIWLWVAVLFIVIAAVELFLLVWEGDW